MSASRAGRPGLLTGVPGGRVAAEINYDIDADQRHRSSPIDYGPMVCICPDGGLELSGLGECQRCKRKPLRLFGKRT